MTEHDRIAFILERDGEEAADAFVRQTYRIYRRALTQHKRDPRRRHFAATPEYRQRFIESCVVFRQHMGRAA